MPEVTLTHNVDDLVRVIGGLPTEVIQNALKEVAKVAVQETKKRYEMTTLTWTHKPEFEAITEVRGNEFTILVGTDDEIYKYVDLGTRPHRIEPKGNYPLRFQWGGPGSYQPKTQPGQLRSSPGGPTGPMVAFWGVNHPGSEARGFSEQIHKEIGPIVAKKTVDLIRKEMDRVLRRLR